MILHDRYTWTVQVVDIEEAAAALNSTTLATWEVYAIHSVTRIKEEHSIPTHALVIVARQRDDVRKSVEAANSSGTPEEPGRVEYLSQEDTKTVNKTVDRLNMILKDKQKLGEAHITFSPDMNNVAIYTEVVRRFLAAGWDAGFEAGGLGMFVIHPMLSTRRTG